MDTENVKSYLELEVVSKDDDMFELQVTATNGRFYGTTKVYQTSDVLLSFANSLLGYPKENKTLIHEAGKKNSLSYFSMKFYSINFAGNVGIEINLEKSLFPPYREEEKDKLKLEIIVEPNAIDRFQKQLVTLATNEDGTAIIFGKDVRLSD
jgi:hypothetical protein